jgi:hypothetical protein
MTIKYLPLNPREEYIYSNVNYFTAWSKNFKFQFSNTTELEDFISKNNLTEKFLIYAVYDNTDACIGTIN